jgi:CBS domain-containing membrane protein
MNVRDLMQTNLKTVTTDALVSEAIGALAIGGVSALPVLDRFGRAVGVLSTREILAAERRCQTAADRERLFERTLALEIMAPWPGVAHPNTPVRDAAAAMLNQHVQRLFVEDHGSLVGVISQTDIVAAVAAARI